MVSVLPSSALADLFLLSSHLHHLPLCVSKLASVWLGIPGSEDSPVIASRDYPFVLIILTPLTRSLATGLGSFQLPGLPGPTNLSSRCFDANGWVGGGQEERVRSLRSDLYPFILP